MIQENGTLHIYLVGCVAPYVGILYNTPIPSGNCPRFVMHSSRAAHKTLHLMIQRLR